MKPTTKISWTEATWNPLSGCSKVSQGCKHCYAERMALRLAAMGQENYKSVVDSNGWNGTINLIESALNKPLHMKEPRMIFVNSMTDLFHVQVPSGYIKKVFDVMMKANQHTYQILTKRPARMAAYLRAASWWQGAKSSEKKHIWLGTSVEDQKTYIERVGYLLQVDVPVRFLSIEPQLGEIAMGDVEGVLFDSRGAKTNGIQWVIVGGESGPGCRPFQNEWARKLRDECLNSDTPFFMKQLGGFPDKQDKITDLPMELRIRQFPF